MKSPLVMTSGDNVDRGGAMAAVLRATNTVLIASDPGRFAAFASGSGWKAFGELRGGSTERLARGVGRRRPGVTLAGLVGLCAVLSAPRVEAGQAWELISVTRGSTWEVNEAKGLLKQSGKVLEGTLNDKKDGKADYRIRIELDGERAKATFRFVSENDEGTTLTGTYSKAAKPTKTHCPEQIQLMNSFQFIGLARNACEP